ncbi:MAG: TIGR03936 family radical SAM-associated protein [Sedimentisphaerales bacterium]|nr:TIGR03936 family radical SAM-associated protein [Sedimentisphaerales bacterium]
MESKNITTVIETIVTLVKFRIYGNLRFLSHAETLTLFQRACTRADINLCYSKGYNPRPKLSLPLPRTVAIVSTDDILVLQIELSEPDSLDIDLLKSKLTKELPQGCELLDVTITEPKTSIQPTAATYELPIRNQYVTDELKSCIDNALESETLHVKRRTKKTYKTREINIRKFIKAIDLRKNNVTVECSITPTGTVRPDEILNLLKLDYDKLSAPISRKNVKWLN